MNYYKSWLAPKIVSALPFRAFKKPSLFVQVTDKRRFFATLAIFFLITFVYDILRSTKISLVISSQESGAEIIPFISVWGILPASILLTLIFTYLSSRISAERVFYAMLAIFLVFFLVFATVLYPYGHLFELRAVSDYMQGVLPEGMGGLIAMVRYWHYSLFYVFGELWGNIVLNMLFWGYINEVTSFNDAKKFYSTFVLGANIAPIFSSRLCLQLRQDNWEDSLNIYIGIVLICGLIVAALFRMISQTPKLNPTTNFVAKKAEGKPNFSLIECFREIGKSKFLLCISVIVLSYYILYNFTDVMWSDQMHQRFKGNPGEMNAYMNNVSMYKGILATLFGFFLSGSILKKWGWSPAALITPLVYTVTCAIFFGCLFLGEASLSDILMSLFSMSFPTFVVLIGSAQHCLIRASKFSVFDATKEIAFTPLDRTTQRKGKAVIDGIGGRLGKSAGSIILQALLYTFGSLAFVVPYLAVLVVVILLLWIVAVKVLQKEISAVEAEPAEISLSNG